MILRGEFAPGLRLGEVELTERLGVSRTPPDPGPVVAATVEPVAVERYASAFLGTSLPATGTRPGRPHLVDRARPARRRAPWPRRGDGSSRR
jgi:hypothetical protein